MKPYHSAPSRNLSLMRPSSVRAFAVCALAIAMSGCGIIGKKVNAYERNILAKPGMAFVENSRERSGINHMLNSREGSTGGFGSAGGGCGCN